ncbi:MAG: hypothetical protein COC05_03975 [Gammaproteobacteria bacterium]|nr:MAG: hypothetical protein COC05_03975 [Gammaproteobacteria bacterium]
MPKTTAIIVSAICSLLTSTAFAIPESSLLNAALNTPVNKHQDPAPIIEASADQPAALALNSINVDVSASNKVAYKKDKSTNRPATIAFVLLTNISFDGEQVKLSAKQTDTIDKAIARIQHSSGEQKSILVTAHADDNGDDAQNLQLSHARAISVANYLKKQGIVENVIRTHSFGRSQPRNENWTESGRQFNRRVSITLIQSQTGTPSI